MMWSCWYGDGGRDMGLIFWEIGLVFEICNEWIGFLG